MLSAKVERSRRKSDAHCEEVVSNVHLTKQHSLRTNMISDGMPGVTRQRFKTRHAITSMSTVAQQRTALPDCTTMLSASAHPMTDSNGGLEGSLMHSMPTSQGAKTQPNWAKHWSARTKARFQWHSKAILLNGNLRVVQNPS